MHPSNADDRVRPNFSISSNQPTRRLSLRLDRDSYTALELAYGHAVKLGLYPMRDKASFVRFLLHLAYREIVELDRALPKINPVHFGRQSNASD